MPRAVLRIVNDLSEAAVQRSPATVRRARVVNRGQQRVSEADRVALDLHDPSLDRRLERVGVLQNGQRGSVHRGCDEERFARTLGELPQTVEDEVAEARGHRQRLSGYGSSPRSTRARPSSSA